MKDRTQTSYEEAGYLAGLTEQEQAIEKKLAWRIDALILP